MRTSKRAQVFLAKERGIEIGLAMAWIVVTGKIAELVVWLIYSAGTHQRLVV